MQQFIRSAARTECDATLSLRVSGDALALRCRCLTPNGFQGTVNTALQLAQLVRIEFRLPGIPHPVTLCARVSCCDGFLYDFELIATNESHRAMFLQLLQEALSNKIQETRRTAGAA